VTRESENSFKNTSYQDFRFSSFPRMRESSHSLKRMDTRLRRYDEFTGLAKVLPINFSGDSDYESGEKN